MMNQAISYLRYSSKGQASGDSERRQEESFNRWLSRNSDKYVPYEAFRDLAKSGYRGKHLGKDGSLGRLLQQAKDGVFGQGDLLVVEAIDRLSRLEPLVALDLFKELVGTGLSVLTLEDNQTYSTESLNSTGLSLMILVYKIQAAHDFSKRLGSRIQAAHDKKRKDAEEGKVNKVISAPWLKNGKAHDPIALLVRKAVSMYLDGYGTRAIAMKITELVKVSDSETRKRYGKPIDARTIRRWLENPALIGHWKTKYKTIEGCFEPVISYSDWLKVQEEIKLRKTKKVDSGLFKHYKISGLVTCLHCGSPFTVRVQKPRPTKDAPLGSDAYEAKSPIRYLNCSRYLKSGSCDNNSTWPYQVLAYIYEMTINECLFQIAMGLPRSRNLERKLNEINEELSKVEEKLSRATKLYIENNESKAEEYYYSLKAEQLKLKEAKSAIELEPLSYRANDGQEFLEDEQEIVTRCEPWEVADDIGKRSLLRSAGYTIEVSHKIATCFYGNRQWTLIKRNQKSRTYTVKESMHDYVIPEQFVAIDENEKPVVTAFDIERLTVVLDELITQ